MTESESIKYRLMIDGEEDIVSSLVQTSFMKHIASYYKQDGINEVLRLSEANSIKARNEAGNVFVVCVIGSKLAGMMEYRDPAHIGLLFVDPDYIGRDIGGGFIAEAKERARGTSDVITVNASPNSVAFYAKCGFTHIGGVKEDGGIVFYPMALAI